MVIYFKFRWPNVTNPTLNASQATKTNIEYTMVIGVFIFIGVAVSFLGLGCFLCKKSKDKEDLSVCDQ